MTLILACTVFTNYPEDSDEAKARRIMLSVNGVFVLGYVPIYEIKQMSRQKCNYFKSIRNFGDILFIIIYVTTLVSEHKNGTTEADSEHYEVTRILYAFLCLLCFLKLLDSMRPINSISFIVRMLISVVYALIPFLSLFLLLILVFVFAQKALGLTFEVDEDGNDTAYTSGIGGLAYFFFILRTSLGDFDVDSYSELPIASQLTIWAMWMLTVGLNTIVFLNFLIAVISDVFEQIMSTRTEQIFLKKAELLLEINEIVGDWAMKDNISSILITRGPKEIKHSDDWNGFFQEIKTHISKRSDTIEAKLTKSTNQLTHKINEKHKETMDAI